MPNFITIPQSDPSLNKFFLHKKIYVMLDLSKLTLDGYPYYQQIAHNFLSQFYNFSQTVANISYELELFINSDNHVSAHMIIHHYLLVDESYLLSEEEQKQNKARVSLKTSQQEVLQAAKSDLEFAKALINQLNSIVS